MLEYDFMGEITDRDFIYLEKFIWDKEKAEINKKKHKITFETAVQVFADKNLYEIYDDKNSTMEEERYNNIGTIGNFVIVFVTSTDRNGLKRIISARLAENDERKLYYENATYL